MTNITLIIFQVISYFLFYGLNVILANNLGHHLYGDFALAYQCLILGGFLVLFGLSEATMKFFPNTKNSRYYIIWCINFFILCTAIYLIILAIISGLLFVLKHFSLAPNLSIHFVVYIFWIVPFVALFGLLNTYLLIKNYIILSSVFFSIFIPGLLIIIILPFILLKYDLTLFSLFVIYFIVYIILSIAEFIIYKFTNYQPVANINLEKNNTGIQKKQWQKFAITIGLANVPYYFVQIIDLSVVEVFHPNEHAVGYYAAILAIVQILIIIPKATSDFVTNKAITIKDKTILQKILQKNSLIITIISTLVSIVIIIFARSLLAHFSPEFTVAEKPLIILSICYIFRNMFYHAAIVFPYLGNEKLGAYIDIIFIIILVITCSIATIYFGIIGTATATGITLLIQRLVYAVIINKQFNIKSTIII